MSCLGQAGLSRLFASLGMSARSQTQIELQCRAVLDYRDFDFFLNTILFPSSSLLMNSREEAESLTAKEHSQFFRVLSLVLTILMAMCLSDLSKFLDFHFPRFFKTQNVAIDRGVLNWMRSWNNNSKAFFAANKDRTRALRLLQNIIPWSKSKVTMASVNKILHEIKKAPELPAETKAKIMDNICVLHERINEWRKRAWKKRYTMLNKKEN